jgi:transposase, IS30 family
MIRPRFSQLSESDRWLMDSMLAQGQSQASVARAVGVHPCTISRERKRGLLPGCDRYFAVVGESHRSDARARAGLARRKLGQDRGSPYWQLVLPWLHLGWSPEQIAGRLKLMPESPSISHETIYCAIYAMPRGALRTELVSLLRKSHAGRLPRARGSSRFTGLQNMTPIALRPPEVAARIVPGHWEGDLIKGARNLSAVGTMIERTSRFVMLAQLDNAGADSTLAGFSRRLRTVPDSLRKTLTYDQGTEMARHEQLAKRLRMDIFFCDPHSPWQRGSNENANGLIREYLPKGTDLRNITQAQLNRIEDSLNNRPRKILDFLTPAEVFANLKLNQLAGVALQA